MKDLLRQLIQADSTPSKGEAAAAEVIATYFNRHGIDCQVDQWDGNRANVVAHVKTGRQRPALLFVCHLDVVSPGQEDWAHPPFGAVEDKGRIYGRGAADMKGGTAAAVAAICEAARTEAALQGDIILAATAGEETDSAGVVRFMQDYFGGQKAEGGEQKTASPSKIQLPESVLSRLSSVLGNLAGIIVPEPTDFAVVTAHRGLFWLKITTRGKSVHSSMPERGINAIGSMKRVLDELERYQVQAEPHPLLGDCSMSINTIGGGEAMNIVPDRCTLGIDIRTLPGQDHETVRYDFERMLARLKTAVPNFDGELLIDRSVRAMETDAECDFVKTFCSAVEVDLTNAIGFTTDAPHLLPLGAPIVIFGPGKPRMCHQVDEYIEIGDLRTGVEMFKSVIGKFLT